MQVFSALDSASQATVRAALRQQLSQPVQEGEVVAKVSNQDELRRRYAEGLVNEFKALATTVVIAALKVSTEQVSLDDSIYDALCEEANKNAITRYPGRTTASWLGTFAGLSTVGIGAMAALGIPLVMSALSTGLPFIAGLVAATGPIGALFIVGFAFAAIATLVLGGPITGMVAAATKANLKWERAPAAPEKNADQVNEQHAAGPRAANDPAHAGTPTAPHQAGAGPLGGAGQQPGNIDPQAQPLHQLRQ